MIDAQHEQEFDRLRSRVSGFVVENYLFGDERKRIGDEDSFIRTGVIDSTGILELIEFLEEAFGVSISSEETVPQNLDGVNKVVHFIMAKRASSRRGTDAGDERLARTV